MKAYQVAWLVAVTFAVFAGLHLHWQEPGRALFFSLLSVGYFITANSNGGDE